jgi:type I restriction enzyme S subunit
VSFPAYPTYGESGLDWAPSLPSHWSSARLRWLASRYAGGTPDKNKKDFWENGTIPWLNSGSVNQGLIREPSAFITHEAFANSSTRWVPAGALLMALAGQGKTKGMAAQLAFRATCNQSMAAIVPGDELVSRYLLWWLSANYQNIRNLSGGDNRDGLNLELLGDIQCPLPSYSEQAAIAAFLDRETAAIDALVEEQRRLIGLLKEKRQAVISHAVTRGLDPTAPMKNSGVEWLGDVPAHWEVRRVGSVSTKITNGYVGPTRDILVEDGVRYLQSLHIKQNKISFNTPYFVEKAWSEDHAKSILKTGDTLIVQTGAIGQVAVVPPEFAGCNCHALIIVSPQESRLCGDWLSWMLNSDFGYHSLLSIQTGALHPHLNCGNVKDLFVPVPPLQEQAEIVAYINEKAASLTALSKEAEAIISLLQERRAALISAAVTGKIDLRSAAAPQAQAA